MTATAGKQQHTPGPWYKKNITPEHGFVFGGSGSRTFVVADVDMRIADGEANARLIAAAPELLEALRELTTACANVRNTPEQLDALAQARAVLAKAEGA